MPSLIYSFIDGLSVTSLICRNTPSLIHFSCPTSLSYFHTHSRGFHKEVVEQIKRHQYDNSVADTDKSIAKVNGSVIQLIEPLLIPIFIAKLSRIRPRQRLPGDRRSKWASCVHLHISKTATVPTLQPGKVSFGPIINNDEQGVRHHPYKKNIQVMRSLCNKAQGATFRPISIHSSACKV